MKIFVLREKFRSTITPCHSYVYRCTEYGLDVQFRGPWFFLSHAAPEDNGFTRWLALQLANERYPVWCDLTKLLGGEAFWEDIQIAIKERTAKFLFVLSCASNEKKGTLDELDCTIGVSRRKKDAIKDFVIPLKIDDLPYDDTYIGIRRLNMISFAPSWAKGLSQLLAKLAEDNVPKDPKFNPDSVASWWRASAEYSAEQILGSNDATSGSAPALGARPPALNALLVLTTSNETITWGVCSSLKHRSLAANRAGFDTVSVQPRRPVSPKPDH